MNKQKLRFGLGLISLVLGSVMSFPVKTIAGQAVVQGTTPDSSSTSGDSFAPSIEVTTEINVLAPSVSPAPGSSPENPNLQVTQEAQVALNTIATNEIAQGASPAAPLFDPTNPNYSQVAAQTQQTMTSDGVDGADAAELISAVGQVVSNGQANLPDKLLVASVKMTKNSEKVAQSGTSKLQVDINKLNKAINIYNKIVRKASPVTLQKLSQNQNFREIGNVLKKLRACLNSK